MQFNNAQFEAGIKQTLASLDALSKGLKLTEAAKGLEHVSSAAQNVKLDHVAGGIQTISDRFKAMSIIGVTALSTIAHRAVDAGLTLIKSLTIDPVKTGLKEYETNLNSIQTVMANTGREGAKGLAEVNKALDELNHYSDQTIYNFSEMAKNIGTFTAAGVSLEVATSAIKGIANLAAVSGSNSQQASAAMYQLSQAISAGKVSLEDWNSVVNAGMGGKVFQNALMETARVHGVAIDKMVKDAGSFRLTLQEGWLTGEILTETLSKFTGDLNAAQLKTMGYNEKQIAEILKMGKIAQDAATKVKTMTQLIQTLQEGAISGWAKSWQLVFGDFEQARELFTSVNTVLGGFINASSDARNKVLGDWNALGGRTALIESIGNAFKYVMDVIRPIGQAFRDIFPPTTGKQLYDITIAIRDFTRELKVGAGTSENIRSTFAGLFAILSIGWDILKGGIGLIARLFGVMTEGSGNVLEVTGNFGDFLVAVQKAIKKGDLIAKAFDKIGDAIEVPIRLIQKLITYFGKVFEDFDGADAAKSVTGLAAKLEPLGKLGSFISNVWGGVVSIFDKVWDTVYPIAKKIGDMMGGLGDAIAEGFAGMNFTDIVKNIFAVFAAGGFISIVMQIRGLVGDVGDIFESLTDTLSGVQNTLRAATLLQIAIAIGVLAASVLILSKVDSAGLTRALAAITVMFTQLFTALTVFEKFIDIDDLAEMYGLILAMTLLGIAVRILASSVKALAELDWNGLAKGLVGVSVILAALVVSMKFMPNPAGLISTGLGLIVLAGAIRLLVESVEELSDLSWEEMAKGLVGVGTLLGALTLFTKFSGADKGGLLQGAGIILLAVGIKILATAVEDFAKMDWHTIGRGLAGMAGGLLLVGAALYLIPPTAPLSAAGVLIVAASLGLIADAVKDMGKMKWEEIGKGLSALAGALLLIGAALYLLPPTSLLSAAAILVVAVSLGMIGDALKDMSKMSWEEIAKGLVALGGALGIITVAMIFMTSALPGAAALLVVAASLAILAPILLVFGQMSWEEMGKGLLMLAGVFLVLGVAGAVLTPVVPTLIGLGIAVTLLGVGMLAAGVGLLAFSVALTALSVAGAAGTVVLVGMVSALAGLIPVVMTKVGEGIVEFAKVIAKAGPAFADAMVAVMNAFIDAVIVMAPKAIDALLYLINLLLTKMQENVPNFTRKGFAILMGFLAGVRDNIGQVVTLGLQIIAAYIDGVGRGLPQVIKAGVNLVLNFINGLAEAIRNNGPRMGEAGANLGLAIVEGMAKGLFSGGGRVREAAISVAKKALNAAMDFLGIASPSKVAEKKLGEPFSEGAAIGIDNKAPMVEKAATNMGKDAVTALGKSLATMAADLSKDIDLQPTIRPVLDLTDVKKNAEELGGYFQTQPIKLDGSYSSAKAASAGYNSNQAAYEQQAEDQHSESVTFYQYNTSPKPLDEVKIYRQTKSQISKAKEVLNSAD